MHALANTHPLHRDHLAVQLCAMQVLNAFGGFVSGGHGNKAIATPAWTASVGHHFGSNNLQRTIFV
jgi:hypothetical protein